MNIFNLLNKRKTLNNYDDKQVTLRAACVAYAILIHSSNLTDILSQKSSDKQVRVFKDLKLFTKQQLVELDSIFSIALLMEAQKLFYESVIEDGDKTKLFENKLYEFFSILNKNIDIKSRATDYVNYISRIGDNGRLMFVGKNVGSCLGEDGIIFQGSVNLLFGNYLAQTYTPSLIKIWQDNDNEIMKIVDMSEIKLPL